MKTIEPTKMPIIAGILNIIGGVFWVGVVLFFVLVIIALVKGFGSLSGFHWIPIGFIFALSIIPAAVAITGGIYSLKRSKWGWALAGSICAIPLLLGLISTTLVVLSKGEFKH